MKSAFLKQVARPFLGAALSTGLYAGAAPEAFAAQEAKDEIAQIRQIDTRWSADLAAKDLDAIMTVYADDAAFLVPNQPIMSGKDEIRAWFKARFETPGYHATFQPTRIVVSTAADMAYEIGAFRAQVTRADGATVETVGKHLVTWQKHDGKWLVTAESISADAREPTVVKEPPAKP